MELNLGVSAEAVEAAVVVVPEVMGIVPFMVRRRHRVVLGLLGVTGVLGTLGALAQRVPLEQPEQPGLVVAVVAAAEVVVEADLGPLEEPEAMAERVESDLTDS